jgi:TolA-binding protein
MNRRFALVAVSAVALVSFSIGADARKCASGKGYRYVNGQKVCPEDYTDSQRLQMQQQQNQYELDRLRQQQQFLEADIQRMEHDRKWRELGLDR